MNDCERALTRHFGEMSEKDITEFIEKIAHSGAKRALSEIGLLDPEDRVSFKEMIALFKDYKSAKAATKGWFWGLMKDVGRYARKIIAVGLFLWILVKIGIPPEKVEQLTKVFK